jgi:hypothetical protein
MSRGQWYPTGEVMACGVVRICVRTLALAKERAGQG